MQKISFKTVVTLTLFLFSSLSLGVAQAQLNDLKFGFLGHHHHHKNHKNHFENSLILANDFNTTPAASISTISTQVFDLTVIDFPSFNDENALLYDVPMAITPFPVKFSSIQKESRLKLKIPFLAGPSLTQESGSVTLFAQLFISYDPTNGGLRENITTTFIPISTITINPITPGTSPFISLGKVTINQVTSTGPITPDSPQYSRYVATFTFNSKEIPKIGDNETLYLIIGRLDPLINSYPEDIYIPYVKLLYKPSEL